VIPRIVRRRRSRDAALRELVSYRESRPTIPRIFHHIWVGPESLPFEFEPYRASWEAHHPEWELRLWTEDNLPTDLRTSAVYERDRRPVERADILRLEVLWMLGGVYVDIDMECLRPLDELVEGVDFFGTEIKPGRITNTVIGAAQRHPILDSALRELRPQKPRARFDKGSSGPLFLARVVREYPRITTYSRELFYPMTADERAEAYAIHHAARTWKDADDWRDVTLRLEDRLTETQRELERERREHAETKRQLEELKRRTQILGGASLRD
jgi:inositol phosphorylceramide mannosyltransferase catalytic subunit